VQSSATARRLHDATSWWPPLGGWVAVAAFNVITAVMRGATTAHDAAARWWLSLDAEVPERTARWFLDGAHGLLVGDWHASDRGPLQAILLLWAGRWSTNPVPAYIAGVVVNSLWVVGLWWFLRSVNVPESRIRWTVVLVALTGSIWLNTVYPWPKLLAGACALGCAAAVLRRMPILAGVLGALALLAHGAALFALIGLVPWAVTRLGKRAFVALLVAGAVYAPWFAFSKLADPPGDRLVKWHIAGQIHPTPRNALREVGDAYERAGIHIVGYKVHNLRVAFGDPTIDNVGGTWSGGGVMDQLRAAQVTRIVWAPGILLVGLFFGWKRVPRTVWCMLAAWLAAYVLLEWGGNRSSSAWLHTAPMALVVAWVAVCALASPRWMLPIQAGVFVGVWLLAPAVLR
jgi:hypothetical protein